MACVDVVLNSSAVLVLVVCISGCAPGAKKRLSHTPDSPPAVATGDMASAYELLRAGRLPEAVAAFSSVASAHPENKRARMELAYARQAAGNLSAAADDFSLVAREPGEFQEQARIALKALRDDGGVNSVVRRDAQLNAGYDALRLGDTERAREKFELALDGDPSLTAVHKQLGYLSLAEGDLTGAVASFEGARRLTPDDCAGALELGYIYARLHNDAKAEKAFASAEWCPDAKVRSAAAAALLNLRAVEPSLYLDIYATPMFITRFQDKIAFVETTAGWKPWESWPISVYLAGRWMQDSKSRGGAIPEIYSDNALSLSPGIKLQPNGMNLNLRVEVVPTLNLTRSGEHPDRYETNRRVILSDYGYIERRRVFGDAGASLGYYSRYRDNVIAYAQLRGGVVVWDAAKARASVYLPVNASMDGNHDFFNNFVEIGVGTELATKGKLQVKLRADYFRGFYMGIQGLDRNPYARAYNDVRITLIWSIRFSLARRRAPAAPVQDSRGPGGFRW